MTTGTPSSPPRFSLGLERAVEIDARLSLGRHPLTVDRVDRFPPSGRRPGRLSLARAPTVAHNHVKIAARANARNRGYQDRWTR